MKRSIVFMVFTAILLCCSVAAFAADDDFDAVVTQKEKGLIDWSNNYIEAVGMAVAPEGKEGTAQGKLLARRGAMVDLQRNMLEFLRGVQIDARTTMDDFMAEDMVRSEVSGAIRNIEILKGEWDEEQYTVTGRIKLPEVRRIVCASIPQDPVVIEIAREERKPAPAARRSGRYTGLIIDVRHLSLVPSVSFRVFDEGGRAVYGMEFVSQEFFLQSGMCAYYNNINYAKGEVHVSPTPISTKAVRLTADNVDIVIPNSAAAMVRGSSYDFRRECKVILVVK